MSYQNFVQCRVVTPFAASATDLGVFDAVAPYVLPPLDGGMLVLTDSPTKPSKVEVIRYAYRTALGLYGLQRGQEGTAAQEWAGPVYAYQALMAGDFQAIIDGLNAAIVAVDGAKLDKTANAVSATKLATARTIGGVAFDGTANISLPGVNAAGSQNTSGNASTASKLATGRTITLTGDVSGSVTFDGSANVSIAATVADDSHNHVMDNVDGLSAALALKAPLASPAFTGNPTAPTPAVADNDTSIATTAFVKAALAALVDSSPAALDTLNELAAALGDDPNFAATMATELGKKLDATSYTAADVLAKMKTVDGAGSGLDADQLDGQDSAFYRRADNLNAGTVSDARLPARLGAVAATISDWNAATSNGWYMASGAINAPEASGWFIGHVENHGAVGWCTQTVHAFSGDMEADTKTWRRDQNNGAWGSWYRLRLSEAEQRAIYLNASNLNTGTIPAARVPTLNQNTTGNAASATKLQTPRTINGVPFDGSSNISIKSNLNQLNQSGATTDQVPVWNGTAWVPGDMEGGGGSGVSLDGPGAIYVTQNSQFTVTDFDVFTDYAVQVSAGTVSISGSTISYAAPNVAGPVTLTVSAGEYHRVIELDILPDRPAAPVITSPVATGVMDNPTISTGAFSLIGPNADTHSKTDWEIWTGPNRTGTLKWSSRNNVTHKLSITATGAGLAVSTQYHLFVRHFGATFGAGEWAELAFRTADQFLPTVIGQAFGGGFYAGKVQQSDGIYVLIVAPKAAETSSAWKNAQTTTAGTASLNDGLANSDAMNNASHAAAQYCRAYNGGGLDDWYLPARDELEVCYRNLKPDSTANHTTSGANTNSVPAAAIYTAGSPAQTSAAAFKAGGAEAFTVPSFYWSSTENSANNAWIQRFSDGTQAPNGKAVASLVRPVRRVKI